MYEAFFDLQRRPFAVTPDPGCWHHHGPYQAALDELVVVAERGQGIGILVAPAGAGKTIVCERLVRELRSEFATVLLRHATFTTRRALLQTILCELERPFDQPTDQELRLGINTLLKSLHQAGRALVLVADEAHQLSEAVLDELRILSDYAIDGRPLVRLILAGQLNLEEKLALPGAEPLNQRIRAHVVLPTLTQAESADYLDYRITWAGGRTEEIFTREAIELVCRASDGVPRCLNQLSDHVLLLAYVKEERPIQPRTVIDALADMSHLSLPWNPVSHSDADSHETSEIGEPSETVECHPQTSDPSPTSDVSRETRPIASDVSPPVYHLRQQLNAWEAGHDVIAVFADATPPQWNHAPEVASRTQTAGPAEEYVVDRYTALDAGLEPPSEAAATDVLPETAPLATSDLWSDWSIETNVAERLTERLAAVQHVLDAVAAADDESTPTWPSPAADDARSRTLPELCPVGDGSAEDSLGAAVLELMADTREHIVHHLQNPVPVEIAPQPTNSLATGDTVFEFGAEIAPTAAAHAERTEPEPRSCRNLFTQLRRKQQGRA